METSTKVNNFSINIQKKTWSCPELSSLDVERTDKAVYFEETGSTGGLS